MALAGTGGPAAAVPARAPAQQNHNVAGHGRFPPHVGRRGRADHRADLHTLGRVAGVVQLVHQPGRKADLVAVGAVARRRGGYQLALGEFTRQGLRHGHQRVRRAGYSHGLIYIRAAGKRIADRAADAGGRAAERLYLRRVVVRLVLEHH